MSTAVPKITPSFWKQYKKRVGRHFLAIYGINFVSPHIIAQDYVETDMGLIGLICLLKASAWAPIYPAFWLWGLFSPQTQFIPMGSVFDFARKNMR